MMQGIKDGLKFLLYLGACVITCGLMFAVLNIVFMGLVVYEHTSTRSLAEQAALYVAWAFLPMAFAPHRHLTPVEKLGRIWVAFFISTVISGIPYLAFLVMPTNLLLANIGGYPIIVGGGLFWLFGVTLLKQPSKRDKKPNARTLSGARPVTYEEIKNRLDSEEE